MTVRRKRPLTSHRWFPGAIALWFAALFGLCSLALPPALLEHLVVAVRLDQVFAAAAPPLGETARLLMAMAMSSVGEIAGLLLGRRLARRHRPTVAAEPQAPAETAPPPVEFAPRKPVSASEELAPIERELAGEVPENLAAHAAAEPSVAPETLAARPVLPDIATAPLESLGVVQLSERLALALQARRPETRFADSPAEDGRLAALATLQWISGTR